MKEILVQIEDDYSDAVSITAIGHRNNVVNVTNHAADLTTMAQNNVKLTHINVKPVVHSEWVYSDEAIFGNPYGRYICSNCNNAVAEKTCYCCKCGADMRGEMT